MNVDYNSCQQIITREEYSNEDGSSYSMRGPSRVSMNVIVFAIRHSRQCKFDTALKVIIIW